MKKLLLGLVCASMIGLSGCVSYEQDVHHTTDISNVNFATTRFKRGTACSNYLFPWFFRGIPLGGDARLLKAVQNGRISKVSFTENRNTNFIIFGQRCIDVYGQ